MKIIKLKKTDYTNMEALLTRAGLVNLQEKTAFPNKIFVNENTYKKIEDELKKLHKKQNPLLSKKSIEYSVGMYLFNLGPNVVLNGGKNLPDGCAIVLPLEDKE